MAPVYARGATALPASAFLTELARDEPLFLRFGLERRLMRIAPSWGFDK